MAVFLMFLLSFFLGSVPLFGNPVSGNSVSGNGVDFSIRFYDRRVYYLEQDPILILITLTNNSPAPFRFRLADERAFSVDFDVRTSSNRAVEYADILVRRRTRSQQVFFREITIETGESFSFVEDLRDYAALRETGTYVVQARLYPELFHDIEIPGPGRITAASSPDRVAVSLSEPAASSNRLTLSIRPRPVTGPDGIPVELDVDTNAVLVREKLSPDEVVTYLLTALQRSQWEKFFLYLDLEALITRDAARRREWIAESEEGRRRMIARFRQELQSNSNSREQDLYMIPSRYTIERTAYNNQSGTVTVMQYFNRGTFTERKRYTWYLEKKDDIWVIVDYTVLNLGTE